MQFSDTPDAVRYPAEGSDPTASAVRRQPGTSETSAAATPVPHRPWFTGCFGCGDTGGLGGVVVRREPDRVTVQFLVQELHQGAPGVAHGGVLAAALDEALGIVIWSRGGRYATARLETDFLAPVPVNSRLTVTARCTGVAGRKAYGEAEGYVGDNLAVRAAALFVALRPGT